MGLLLRKFRTLSILCRGTREYISEYKIAVDLFYDNFPVLGNLWETFFFFGVRHYVLEGCSYLIRLNLRSKYIVNIVYLRHESTLLVSLGVRLV